MNYLVINKLGRESIDLMYAVNNVSVGIREALKLPKLKKDKEIFTQLKILYNEVNSIDHPYTVEQINMKDIQKVENIRLQAFELLKKYLNYHS
ncbi:hypothetical protein [Aquimarina mytili]|uniref:Uncharacterized protein n=1 Tax=Aquimarina mytili TaxID=874423 RepID=A0A936ZVE4_9FLAO|nr:hypothetical protein [Aquimarina mytili]MBL0682911.1 hypothetical protein [Aquimarina mytili]